MIQLHWQDDTMSALQIPVTKVFPGAVTETSSKMARLKQLKCTDKHERQLRAQGFVTLAGVDEVGRGCLFGSVVAAAVVLPEKLSRLKKLGLRDSKQLPGPVRTELDREVRAIALAVSIAEVDAATIDRVNIYQASRLAMLRAVQGLSIAPDHLLIDAMLLDHPCAQTKLIYGDSLSLSIAAASVVAKVYRDAQMIALDAQYPQYGLASHKGYATPTHRRALREHGPCEFHRRSFAPVAALLAGPLFPEEFHSEDNMLEEDAWDPD
jgi:ribonuclease HII